MRALYKSDVKRINYENLFIFLVEAKQCRRKTLTESPGVPGIPGRPSWPRVPGTPGSPLVPSLPGRPGIPLPHNKNSTQYI